MSRIILICSLAALLTSGVSQSSNAIESANQTLWTQARLAGLSLYPSLSLLRPLAGVIHTFWPINRFQRA